MPTIEDLGRRVKAKYPGSYDDLEDADLGRKVKAKYPGAYDDFTEAQPVSPASAVATGAGALLDATRETAAGFAKGAVGNTISGLAGMAGRVLKGPQNPIEGILTGALGPLGPLVGDIVGSHIEQGKQAIESGRQGDYLSAAGHGLAAVTPMVGPMAAAVGEKLGEGLGEGDLSTTGEALGEGAVLVGTAAAPRATAKAASTAVSETGKALARVPGQTKALVTGIPQHPQVAMMKAIKPIARKIDFKRTLDRALPEVKASEQALGRPIAGAEDMLEAVKVAKRRVRAQYDAMAGPAREMGSTVDLTPVADAMFESIPSKLKLEDPQAAAAMVDRAAKYRGRFPLEQAEEFLKTTNAELESYYAKYPTARTKATNRNPETATLTAQAEQLRKQIYNTLDQPGQGAAAQEIQRRYGSLLSLEEELYRRVNVAERQAPYSLGEQMGRIRAAYHVTKGIATGNPVEVVSAIAERKIAKWMKEKNQTDTIIRETMKRYTGRPVPVRPPARPRVAGLLGPGPVVTPPPADTSFVKGVPAERPRALPAANVPQRKMLPAPGGGPLRSRGGIVQDGEVLEAPVPVREIVPPAPAELPAPAPPAPPVSAPAEKAAAAPAADKSMVEGSAEYKAAYGKSAEAIEAYTKAREDYRAGRIGDDEFLTARAEHEAAMKEYDAAYQKETTKRAKPAPAPAPKAAEPKATAEKPKWSLTEDELSERFISEMEAGLNRGPDLKPAPKAAEPVKAATPKPQPPAVDRAAEDAFQKLTEDTEAASGAHDTLISKRVELERELERTRSFSKKADTLKAKIAKLRDQESGAWSAYDALRKQWYQSSLERGATQSENPVLQKASKLELRQRELSSGKYDRKATEEFYREREQVKEAIVVDIEKIVPDLDEASDIKLRDSLTPEENQKATAAAVRRGAQEFIDHPLLAGDDMKKRLRGILYAERNSIVKGRAIEEMDKLEKRLGEAGVRASTPFDRIKRRLTDGYQGFEETLKEAREYVEKIEGENRLKLEAEHRSIEERTANLKSLDEVEPRITRGWMGNLLTEGRYISDGHILIDTEAVKGGQVKAAALRKQDTRHQATHGKAEKLYLDAVKSAEKPLSVLGQTENAVYLADDAGGVYATNVNQFAWLRKATKATEYRLSADQRGKLIVLYSQGKPVAMVTTLREPKPISPKSRTVKREP